MAPVIVMAIAALLFEVAGVARFLVNFLPDVQHDVVGWVRHPRLVTVQTSLIAVTPLTTRQRSLSNGPMFQRPIGWGMRQLYPMANLAELLGMAD